MSEYVCVTQKCRDLYRIAVRNRSGKPQYVHGYLTETAAKDDIGNVLLHLKGNKRLGTFQKSVGEEDLYQMKKRPRCNQKPPPESKSLRGMCLIQQRRKINHAYWLYKSKFVSNNEEKALSKESFVMTFGDASKAVLVDERRRSIEQSLKYLRSRMALLQTRKVKNLLLIEQLQKHVYGGTCYDIIIERSVLTENSVIDLTEDRRFTIETTSKCQLTRVILQGIIVLNVLQFIQRKINTEEEDIKLTLGRIENSGNLDDIAKDLIKLHEEKK